MIVAKSSFGPGFESPRLHHAGATGFDGAPDAAGGNGQATVLTGANHKGHHSTDGLADGCLTQPEAALAGRVGTEARHLQGDDL